MPSKHWSTGFVALGCLSYSSWVCAQSSVTLYGIVDVAIDISNQGNGTLAAMQGGGLNSSEFGLKGVEDLGSGYKAIFDLENGFSSSSGVLLQNGLLFGRQAWMGLAAPWGTVTFGRQYSPEYVANSANDAFSHGLAGGLSNIGTTQAGKTAGVLTAYSITGRTNNSINYVSPTIDGFTLRAMYGVGGTAGSLSDGSSVGAGASLAVGPATLNGGFIRNRPTGSLGTVDAYTLGGNVGFGAARVIVAYSKDVNATTPGATLRFALENVGVQYQLGVSDRLLGQVIRIVDTSDPLPTSKSAYIAALALVHSLSTRTSIYCAYAQVWNKEGSAYSLGGAIYTGAPATPNATGRNLQIGIQTLF
ncbi:porin [Burkholderia sp. L27(2015)]|uniref:porin n=1 Tax=Burkholderia sp. L27(2015) TaxID=1641858 RepID=UPI00131D7F82|nr:porin [Burkholderia sp. L27(2015)]